MVKEIFSFDVAIDFRYSKPVYVLYATGKWDYHTMDWAGMNCQRIKVPNQLIFHTYEEAREFEGKIKKELENMRDQNRSGDVVVEGHEVGYYYGSGSPSFNINGSGYHLGDYETEYWECRLVTRTLTQQEFIERKERIKILNKVKGAFT